jgi:hypothetical protein
VVFRAFTLFSTISCFALVAGLGLAETFRLTRAFKNAWGKAAAGPAFCRICSDFFSPGGVIEH